MKIFNIFWNHRYISGPREIEERRQSIEEFIEMSLGNPGGSSPIKNTIYVSNEETVEEVPMPPKSINNSVSEAKKVVVLSINNATKKPKKGDSKYSGTTDFFTPYDIDQVAKSGQSIISTESLPLDALCFLCGSKGQEEMLLCKNCCEPYHPFCLNPEELPQTSEAEINWICRKCIQCQICGRNEGEKRLLRCAKCAKGKFHE